MTWLKKSKVVIDTNIFVSAILFGGNPKKILELLEEEKFDLLISPDLYVEIFSKLDDFSAEEILTNNLRFVLDYKAFKIAPKKTVNVCRDPKDNMLLSLCGEGHADFLITGDKDLLVLKNFKQTKILNPKDFLKIV